MKRMVAASVIVGAIATLPFHAQERNPRIHQLEELTWRRIDALPRERTMFILPIGMLEEHGPHLPIGADTIGVTFEADAAARRISQVLPQWELVMMPPLHYGNSGANNIGGLLVHPGTYPIRQSTLRAVVADLGAQVAQNGFKWVFVMNGHGAPLHNIAINEACDFVSDSFGMAMLHLTALFRADPAIQAEGKRVIARHFSPGEIESFGIDVHAGVAETSTILALRPDLVSDSYKKLPALTGRSLEELLAIGRTPGWQGYLSVPAKATAAYGRDSEAWWVDGFSDLVVRATAGQDLRKAPRVPERLDPALSGVFEKILANERAFESRFQDWLARRR